MEPDTSAKPAAELRLNGDSMTLAADRAVNELRHGRYVAIVDGERALIVATLDEASPAAVARMRELDPGAALILTAERAMALDAGVIGPISIALTELPSIEALRIAAGLDEASANLKLDVHAWSGSNALVAAAFRLAKIARTIPALLGTEADVSLADPSIVSCSLQDVEATVRRGVPALERMSAGRVPLMEAEDSIVTLFREPLGGGEHVAVTIGNPDLTGTVPVRLHSACLTGDVLGSLRCDCGDQLRTAVRRIAALGGGVLLYLDQEGRGIGLANKLRAYTFQDAGMDTLDADHHLGFRADERSYGVAAAMLRELGIGCVQLLTNNPQKIDALRELGIDVVGRMPLITSTNVHNERYLRAKRERAGHLSEDTGS